MTADPKNPNDDATGTDGSEDTADVSETQDVLASDNPSDAAQDEAAADDEVAAPEHPETPVRQERESGGRGLVVLLVVVLCFAAAAAGAALGPRFMSGDSATGLAALQSEVAALKAEVDALRNAPDQSADLATRVDSLETEIAPLQSLETRLSDAEGTLADLAEKTPQADSERLDTLAARIESLESAPAATAGDGSSADAPTTDAALGELRDRALALIERIEALPQGSFASLAGLEERLAALDAATQANTDAVQNVAGVENAVSALRSQVETLQNALDALESRAVDPGSAFVLATSQLRDAVATGNAYRDRLDATTALAPDDAEASGSLQTLASHADTGVATSKELGERLPAAISDAVTADRVATSQGWFDQTLAKLEGLVSVRRIDGQAEGSDADAVTARAEALFNDGDLEGALKELEGLSEQAAGEMSGWIADARAHLDVHQALDDLNDRAIALVSGTVN